MQKKYRNTYPVLVLLLLLPFTLHSGTTGKIAGAIKDKLTGEPLPGANIQIQGTYMGAASDLSGNYFMLSIPPGNYTVVATMMGYEPVAIQKVSIRVDQTTRLEIEMTQEVMDLGESVVIVAERPQIQKDLTTSIEVLGLEDMKQTVARDVDETVNLQTGVFFDPIPVEGNLSGTGRGEKRYSVRGGEQDEVIWFVDGMRASSMTEAKADGGGSFTQLNQDAVQEIQVITGGFNAEYGQAQSGIVNVITKEGSQNYTFSVDYNYSPPHQRHFGDYIYDPEKNIEFQRHTLEDGTLDPNWWTPERQRQVYDYRNYADHELRFSLGGSIPGSFLPFIGSELEKMTFFLTGRYQEEPYELPRPRATRDLTNIDFNGKYVIQPGLSLKFGGMWSHDKHATNAEESFPSRAKYYRGYGSLLDNYYSQFRLGLTHAIKPEMFYEIKLSSYTFTQKEKPSPYRVLGESTKPDVWGWHYYDSFEDEPFVAHLFSPTGENSTNDLSLISNLSWQINHNNLIKTGIEFHYFTYKEDSWVLPSFSDNLQDYRVRGINEIYHPFQFAAYIQDKMEFESMILNMGLRYDFFDGNREWFNIASFEWNPSLDPNYIKSADPDLDGIDTLGHKKWDFQNVLDKPRSKMDPFHSFNPRIGISFPVTDETVFHFSYGHFYQVPAINAQYEFAYFRPVAFIKNEPVPGPDYTDPERVINMTVEPLKPEKTIQFEMGIKHHFKNLTVLNVTGYYKDIFDRVERAGFLDRLIYGVDPFGRTSNLPFSSRFSGDYADARGIEVSLKTLFSNNFVVNINYSFSKSTRGTATPRQIKIDENGETTYLWYVDAEQRLPTENSYSRPHILRANLFMQYPGNWSLPLLTPLLKDTDLNLLYRYISGQAFTYREPDDPPDLLDNKRFPARQTWDLKFNKYFEVGHHSLVFYTKVTNLFNNKNIKTYGLPIPFGEEALKHFVETGEPSPIDPDGYNIGYSIYYEPRSIWVGFRYNFR